jgi:hypothetical protein
MSTPIYTREECKKLIDELGIISYKNNIKIIRSKITFDLKESIIANTINCRDNITERIYWIFNNIENYPNCKECNKQFFASFNGYKNGYCTVFCSSNCSAKNTQVRQLCKQTCLEKYGTENVFQSIQVQERYKQTCLERYGVENTFQSKESKEKIKHTCLEKYGVENISQSEFLNRKK